MFELPSEKNTKSFELDLRYAKEKLNKSKLTQLKVA
jgi:hypothetical protein